MGLGSNWKLWIRLVQVVSIVGLMALAIDTGCRLDRLPMQEREIAAIKTIRAVQKAEDQYHSEHHRYGSMDELREAGFTENLPQSYRFRIAAAKAHWKIEAWPTEFRKTGARSFLLDESRQVRMSWTSRFDAGQARLLE